MLQSSNVTHLTEISANVVMFCRFLRKNSYNISATEEADALRAISFLPIHSEHNYREALKAVLSKSPFQRSKFDQYYQEFKEQLKKAADAKVKDVPEEQHRPQQKSKQAQFEALKDWLNLSPSEEVKEVAAFSDLEVMTKKDFLDLNEDEMRLMMRVLQRLARKMAHQKSRLKKLSKRHRRLDLKQTIRSNMRRGGEIQQLLFSDKKDRKLKLVLLCDVSRSMDLYSRFFIHLMYAFQNSYDKIETLVFSTALHRVTEIMDNNAFDKAFDMISDRVPQWSGGTTIGSCLNNFAHTYGHAMLNKKTIVLILSDGWDTGEPLMMKEAMKTIYRKSRKLIWLNPLAGSPDFSPESLGMKVALPYIDILASAHNLESLRQVLWQLRGKRNLLNRQY